MKKLLLTAILILGVNSYSAIPRIKEWTCPIDGEKFKEMYADSDSFDKIPICPTSKFIMFKENFTKEEIDKYKEILKTDEYRKIESSKRTGNTIYKIK